MTRIAHVITGLQRGGAEAFLYRFLTNEENQLDHMVISLGNGGVYGPLLEQRSIRVFSVGLKGLTDLFPAIRRLNRLLEDHQIELVQSWLYKADFVAALALKSSMIPLIWNIRQSNVSFRYNTPSNIVVSRILSRWSARVPAYIVYCAHAARQAHEQMGYSATSVKVIPNGIDCDIFYSDQALRQRARHIMDVDDDEFVIANVARYDPQKGHADFLKCASKLIKAHSRLKFVLIGKGMEDSNRELRDLVRLLGLDSFVMLLGERDDVPRLLNGSDLYLSCSVGEGWPNAIAEAMACALPVVATDVGDTQLILGSAVRAVTVHDVKTLADQVSKVIEMPTVDRRELGHMMRKRVVSEFSVAGSARQYEALYSNVLGQTST